MIVDEIGKIIEILLSSGEKIFCDLLIVVVGVCVNVSFLEGLGIEMDRFGFIIDELG